MARLESEQPLKDYGLQVFNQGYSFVPVAPSSKKPKSKDWQKTVNTTEQIEQWAGNGKALFSIGLLTRCNPAIDADIYDTTVAEAFAEAIQHITRGSLQRVGLDPKRAFIFRTDGTPFKKITSPKYRSPDGQIHRIEILGDGQQIVVAGIHPQTNDYYRFIGENDITNTPCNSLPVLTEKLALEVIKIFSEVVPDDWEVVNGQQDQEASIDRYVSRVTDYSDQDIVETINMIDPDADRDIWIKVGMALWHQFEPDLSRGFAIWDTWSKQGTKYKASEMRKLWNGFDYKNRLGKPVTLRSILAITDPNMSTEPRKDINTRYLDRFVYLPSGKIVDLDGSIRAQERARGHSITAYRDAHPNDYLKVKSKRVHAIYVWRDMPEKTIAQGFKGFIGQGRIVEDEHGLKWINTYAPPAFGETKDEHLLTPFFNHMDYLFPNDMDRKWFYGWMAHLVQRPQERCKFTPLHISPETGTGRGLLNSVIREMVGLENAATATMAELNGQGSSSEYTDYMAAAYVSIAETCAEDKNGVFKSRGRIGERAKHLLECDYDMINFKGSAKEMRHIAASFFLQSNHLNAVAIDANDRRIWAIRGARFAQPAEYYQEAYTKILAKDALCQLYNYLKRMDISWFNIGMRGDAMDWSGIRHYLVAAGASSGDTLVADWLDDNTHPVISHKHMTDLINASMQPDRALSPAEALKVLQKTDGVHQWEPSGDEKMKSSRLRVNGLKMSAWIVEELTEDNNDRAYVQRNLKRFVEYVETFDML